MRTALLIAMGSALGAILRYLSEETAVYWFGPGFPWGTLFVNVAGSLLMGVFIGTLIHRLNSNRDLRLFIATGVLGGFTTFSTFSLEIVLLWENGALFSAVSYTLASVFLGVSCLAVGLWMARRAFVEPVS